MDMKDLPSYQIIYIGYKGGICMNQKITSENAPKAIGPYSQAIMAKGDTIYVSGQLPIDASTGMMVPANIVEQTKMSIHNISKVLEEAGATLKDVVSVTVYLKDMNTFADMNNVYNEMFTEPYPARVAVEVSKLPKDALVEISAIAQK